MVAARSAVAWALTKSNTTAAPRPFVRSRTASVADASERNIAAGSQIDQAKTVEQARLAKQTALEGLYYIRAARLAMGMDPGPEIQGIAGQKSAGHVTEDRKVDFEGRQVEASPNPSDRTPNYYPGGRVDAGTLNISVWEKLVEAKKVDPAKVRVFYTTPGYYDYNWSVRADMNPVVRKKLTDAFLALDPSTPEGKEILELQRATKFIPTKAENYKDIEAAARDAKLLK